MPRTMMMMRVMRRMLEAAESVINNRSIVLCVSRSAFAAVLHWVGGCVDVCACRGAIIIFRCCSVVKERHKNKMT